MGFIISSCLEEDKFVFKYLKLCMVDVSIKKKIVDWVK